jgi:hypothetical protein
MRDNRQAPAEGAPSACVRPPASPVRGIRKSRHADLGARIRERRIGGAQNDGLLVERRVAITGDQYPKRSAATHDRVADGAVEAPSA